ncbi:MAG: SMI1/KNR4 family protein [Tannerella sp.]|jgi:hypothetical protein|nr:SMI1/KNR4 family protein [Tannerella sp.]
MIEIAKKEDIVIPFDKIGEKNWETETREIIQSLAEMWNDDLPEPKTDEEIKSLEDKLGAKLPDSLKLFYKTFGIAPIGEQLMDFNEIGWIKDIWAEAPEYGPDFTDGDKEVLPFLITFSDYLGNGNMFCFHRDTKEVYYFDHDDQPYLTKLFDTVDDYLKGCLIFCQTDLFKDGINQREVEQWTEEIVSGLYGQKTLKKWRY